MNHRLLTAMVALTLGAAAAQTTTPTTPAPTTNVTLPGTIPASVSRTGTELLKTFLASGGQVKLLNAAGAVIGTVNADGTVTLVSGATLADARTVQVIPTSGTGEAQSYTLARDLSKPGAIKLEVSQEGRTVSLPLSALVNRQAPVQAVPAPTEPDEDEDEDGDGQAKPDKAPKDKPANPGKGKGKNK